MRFAAHIVETKFVRPLAIYNMKEKEWWINVGDGWYTSSEAFPTKSDVPKTHLTWFTSHVFLPFYSKDDVESFEEWLKEKYNIKTKISKLL